MDWAKLFRTDRSKIGCEAFSQPFYSLHQFIHFKFLLGAPAAYKYFSRAEYYSTTSIHNYDMTASKKSDYPNLKKTVNTDNLNVNEPKETQREHAIPGQIKRDTAAVAGGKQVGYRC